MKLVPMCCQTVIATTHQKAVDFVVSQEISVPKMLLSTPLCWLKKNRKMAAAGDEAIAMGSAYIV